MKREANASLFLTQTANGTRSLIYADNELRSNLGESPRKRQKVYDPHGDTRLLYNLL